MPPDQLVELYREAFRRHGNSPEAVLWPKGRQHLRFAKLTTHFRGAGFSVLDFGCGLGHLRSYLDRHYLRFEYTGVDLVPEFVTECRRNFPDSAFTQISDIQDITGEYDYVVLSGVFNILYVPDREEHMGKVLGTLEHLFERTRVALSCDFMTDRVDFQGEGAFHMNEAELVGIVQQRLSGRYSIDHSYMPYEFALTIYRDQHILRPDNIYHGTPDADPSR